MLRFCRVLLIAVAALGVAAPPAAAVPDRKLAGTLGVVWETLLETPTPQNPFGGGDPCLDLWRSGKGRVVAPVQPAAPGAPKLTCTVKPGTKLFIMGYSSECSTVEPPPFFGGNEVQLRNCARAADGYDPREPGKPPKITATITVDGKPVPVSEVETGLLNVVLPEENIFGAPAGPAQSVAHGYVALLNPLTPGRHKIEIHAEGTAFPGDPQYAFLVNFTNTTIIIVKR